MRLLRCVFRRHAKLAPAVELGGGLRETQETSSPGCRFSQIFGRTQGPLPQRSNLCRCPTVDHPSGGQQHRSQVLCSWCCRPGIGRGPQAEQHHHDHYLRTTKSVKRVLRPALGVSRVSCCLLLRVVLLVAQLRRTGLPGKLLCWTVAFLFFSCDCFVLYWAASLSDVCPGASPTLVQVS